MKVAQAEYPNPIAKRRRISSRRRLRIDVERIGHIRSTRLELADQGRGAIGRRQRRVGGVARLAVEIDAGMVQPHSARGHREHDVWCLRLAVGIGYHAQLDGVEYVAAIAVGATAAEPP
jgi:hypothetical protein